MFSLWLLLILGQRKFSRNHSQILEIILVFGLTTSSSVRIINCDSEETNLETNEFVRFQTPNYPKFYSPSNNKKIRATSCKNSFVVSFKNCLNVLKKYTEIKRSKEGGIIWFVFVNGFITQFDLLNEDLNKTIWYDHEIM